MSLVISVLLAAVSAADPCVPVDPAAIAGLAAEAISRELRVPATAVRYEPQGFLLRFDVDGSTATLTLDNFVSEYCSAGARRTEVLARFARVAAASGRAAKPGTYAQTKPSLLPVVRSRIYIEHAKALGQVPAGEPLGAHLFVAAVVDTPDSMAYVTTQTLSEWGVSWPTVLADGLANLRARSREPFVEVAPGVWSGPWEDAYAPSRLLLTTKLREVVGGGDAVVTIPHQNAIFVARPHDAKALVELGRRTEEALGRPRAVSALPMLVGPAGVTTVFSPKSGHGAHEAMARLRLGELKAVYDDDKARLDREHEASGKDVFVPSFMTVQTPAGELTSVCVATLGVHSLLPQADVVVFMDLERRESVAEVPFDVAVRALGARARRLDGYPPRWEVKEFPPAAELAKLGHMPGARP